MRHDDERKEKKRKARKCFQEERRHNLHLTPQNERQQCMIDSLLDNTVTIAVGAAGTGKTFLATLYASKQVAEGYQDKIILVRPNVPTGRTLGHFPGTVEEKLYPYLSHILEYVKDFVGKGAMEIWLKNHVVEMQPLETIRGKSFRNTIVIVDEAQNLVFDELKALSTRIGEDSKLILCGDSTQSDIKGASALETFVGMCQKYDIDSLGVVRFAAKDCLRSGICKDFTLMFDKEGV